MPCLLLPAVRSRQHSKAPHGHCPAGLCIPCREASCWTLEVNTDWALSAPGLPAPIERADGIAQPAMAYGRNPCCTLQTLGGPTRFEALWASIAISQANYHVPVGAATIF